MKTAPLFICFLAAQLSFAADSLIVNAGSNSRVIFYGKSPADLKNLERLDLNKLLRDLNQTQDSTSERLQMSSESYRVAEKPLPKWKQFWQEYKKNTFFNFHVGMGTRTLFNNAIGSYEYFRLPNPAVFLPNPPTQNYTLAHSLWLRTRSVVGVSLLHQAYLLEGKKSGLKLNYGIGVEALGLRYEYLNRIETDRELMRDNPSGAGQLLTAQGEYVREIEMYIWQTDVRAMGYNAQLMPKFFLKDKKRKESFSFGLGVRYNLSYTRQPINGGVPNVWGGYTRMSRTPIVSSKDIFYSTRDADVSSFTFMAEIGYRSISLFAQYTPAFTQIQPNLRPNASANAQYFNQRSGNLGFVNFGLKFGR
jgi:hypothetical protein